MLRKSTDSLVIRPRLPSTVRLLVVLVTVAVVISAALGGYWWGQDSLREQLQSRVLRIESLEERLNENTAVRNVLQSELATTREQLEKAESSLAKVRRQLEVDQSAYRELRKQLEASNRQITELGNELKFYRSIISPADGRSGVRIQEFELQPTDTEREYRYRLILIQALEHEEAVKGVVRFEINGTKGGSAKTIRSPGDSEGRISAEFKYFQNFAGTLRLPAEFLPAEIKVIFETNDDTVVQRMYPWPEGELGRTPEIGPRATVSR